MMAMNYKIVNNEVLVEVLETPRMRGSLYIPKTARETLQLGRVLQNNTSLPLQEGDVVGFQNWKGRSFPDPEKGSRTLWLLEPDHVEVKLVP